VRVTSVAGEGEAGGIVETAMLLRHDVFHVECNERRCKLRQAAIFTRVPALPRTKSRVLWSNYAACRERKRRAFVCIMETTSRRAEADSGVNASVKGSSNRSS
jgi:hypothetical protein